MRFSPRNRHLLVEVLKQKSGEEDSKPTILLPDGYKPTETEQEYVSVRIKEVSPDCTISITKGDLAIASNRMIEEITIGDETSHLVLENYIIGVMRRT
ncbi:MAG: hypothetical protein NWE77_00015 [Candidatus Bathyarchaeota archaeon]|nr:hypothetical protein [Candidatus Bathyarchaeota archaeon]